MPSTIVADVAVQELTKFGFKMNNEYVNYSKNLSEGDRVKVVPGVKFQAELYVADSGKKYLNKIFSMLQKADPVKKETPVIKASMPKTSDKVVTAPFKTKSEEMTRADWDNKDRRISRQGVIQAAVQALTGVYPTVTELYDAAEELALKMLDFVNEKGK
jgi:hypothetical protein